MANDANGPELYWTGGPFRVGLGHPNTSSPASVRDALAALEDFRDACQRQYIAFHGMINGRHIAYEQFKALMKDRDKTVHVGTAFPEDEQRPGHSWIGKIPVGQLLDGLAPGGEFETEHAKAVIVMIFSMWEERHRRSVANAMSVQTNQVMCTLMNDIRHVRNCIVHHGSVICDGFAEKLVLLPQIWAIAPGELRIAEDMLHGLMEQINALRVEIVPQLSPGTTK